MFLVLYLRAIFGLMWLVAFKLIGCEGIFNPEKALTWVDLYSIITSPVPVSSSRLLKKIGFILFANTTLPNFKGKPTAHLPDRKLTQKRVQLIRQPVNTQLF